MSASVQLSCGRGFDCAAMMQQPGIDASACQNVFACSVRCLFTVPVSDLDEFKQNLRRAENEKDFFLAILPAFGLNEPQTLDFVDSFNQRCSNNLELYHRISQRGFPALHGGWLPSRYL